MFTSRWLGLLGAGLVAFGGGLTYQSTVSEAASLRVGVGVGSVALAVLGVGAARGAIAARNNRTGNRTVRGRSETRTVRVVKPRDRVRHVEFADRRSRRRDRVVVVVAPPPPRQAVVERARVSEPIRTARPVSSSSTPSASERLPTGTALVSTPMVTGLMGDSQSSPGAAAPPAGNFIWNHNNSVMRMTAEADQVRFYYDVPRTGLSDLGITPGTLLFEGRVNGGNSYSGNVSTFSRDCGTTTFVATGQATSEGNRLELTGRKPNRDRRCQVVGYQEEKLVFELQPR